NLPDELPPCCGSVTLALNNPEAVKLLKYLPATKYSFSAVSGKEHFRAEPSDERSFAPSGLNLFRQAHVYDPQLYRATQQDFLQAAAGKTVPRTGNPVVPASRDPDLDPPGPSFPAVDAELKCHRENSVLFVSTPKEIPSLYARRETETPARAEAIDYRMRLSQNDLTSKEKVLYAEDLIAGVSVFVRPVRPERPARWHSLCRRVVHVTRSGRAALNPFEEEGYVATGTSIAEMPLAGIVVGQNPPDSLTIRRLLEENLLQTKETVLTFEQPVKYTGNFHDLVTAADVAKDDIVHTSCNKNKCKNLQIVPVVELVGSPPTSPTDAAVIFVKRAGDAPRPELMFAVAVSPARTQFLDAKGKVLKDTSGSQKTGYALFLERLKADPPCRFFVEGNGRMTLAGPLYAGPPRSPVRRIQADKFERRPATGETVLVHGAVPTGILRPCHVGPADEFRALPLAARKADGFEQIGDELSDVREVTSGFNRIRGLVTKTAFELTAVLRPVAGDPTRLFLIIDKQPWEFGFDGPDLGPLKPGQLQCPRVFDDQPAATRKDWVNDWSL
ncbi:MAG TPA: hypothetical protein VH120_12970, partial [Gemmataceae bacterium]|nr:hypothetical protein [Gemmataceae bacterium]